ncbi:Hypothetical predicted protein [Paramuricea clavata]|uniref:DDE Tnp4 domain-containing protein n=1 Tax=Paramuricea clavata TaxID=317549 RepID=A0A6S7J8K4_PARCT|nr:Hypothetical predicted protein [Paramuricea clavata]
MAGARRRNCDQILNYMMYTSDSDDSSSSDSDDDNDLLFFETCFATTRELGTRINLQDISEDDCEKMFRFEKYDIPRLRDALKMPDRLAYPNRLSDLTPIFARTEYELSLIFNTILDDIYERFNYLLTSIDLVWLDPDLFSRVIHAKGAPLDQCWGFIDGTPRPIARPIRNQKIMYSGHKRIHCLKFQSVQAPNGLIENMFGPIEGSRHDAFMLGISGLQEKLRQLTKPDGEPYVIYGDPAYGLSYNILAPYRGNNLSDAQKVFNRDMSRVRVNVEWGFGKISQIFAYLDFKTNLKVLLQPIGIYYLIGALLTNCHTCLYGSLTSSFFNLEPPVLETYLSNYIN